MRLLSVSVGPLVSKLQFLTASPETGFSIRGDFLA